jgi:hypothetical protein
MGGSLRLELEQLMGVESWSLRSVFKLLRLGHMSTLTLTISKVEALGPYRSWRRIRARAMLTLSLITPGRALVC